MTDNFTTCEFCGEQKGTNTPGCPTCETRYWTERDHSGYFDLTKGWTCYAECPQCEQDRKTDKMLAGPDCENGEHEYADWNCPSCGQSLCFSCAVKTTDESKPEGMAVCWNCNHTQHYPFQ